MRAIAWMALACLVFAAPLVTAQNETFPTDTPANGTTPADNETDVMPFDGSNQTNATVVATSDCPATNKTLCLMIVDGDLESLVPGTNVTVTFRNDDDTPHNLHVAALSDADPAHEDTRMDVAIAMTNESVAPGDEEEITFRVPADGDALYLWCDMPGHEAQGMWLEVSPEALGVPMPPIVGVLALAAAAFLVRRRR